MIKRRLAACYLFFGLAALLLVYSLNTMYVERYEIGSESHVQNGALQAPNPFPKGKPDFREKHGADQKNQEEEEKRKQEEEKRKQEEARLQKEEEDKRNKELEEQKQKEEEAKKLAAEEAEAKALKEAAEEKEAKEKAAAEKKVADEKKAAEEKKAQAEAETKKAADEAKEKEAKKEESEPETLNELATALLNEGTEPLTEEELAKPLSTRVANRRKNYRNWMKRYRTLSQGQRKILSSKLQGRFLSLEGKEIATFKEKIQYTEAEMVDGKVQPAGKKVVLLTATDGQGNSEIQDVLGMALENRAEYAAYHGYNDYFVNLTKFAEPDRHPVWNKISAIKEGFDENPDAEWLWWIDTDIIIMNPEIDLAEHILSKRALTERLTYGRPLRNPETNFENGVYMKKGEVDIDNLDVIISQDFFGLNAGSFFIRRSAFSNLLLDIWDDPMYVKANFIRREQDALMHLFLFHDQVQEHVGLVPQRLLNSYQDKPEWVWAYKEGDFVIHFAGCNTRGRCDEVWKTNWNNRGRVPAAFRTADSKFPAGNVGGTSSASDKTEAATA